MENRRTTVLALVAVVLTLGALWYVNRPVVVQEATPAQVRAEAARGGYRLIDTPALAKLYRQPPANFLLVDTRQDWEYRSGHLACRGEFSHRSHLVGQVQGPGPPGGLAGTG